MKTLNKNGDKMFLLGTIKPVQHSEYAVYGK